jgi:hypothetical protein
VLLIAISIKVSIITFLFGFNLLINKDIGNILLFLSIITSSIFTKVSLLNSENHLSNFIFLKNSFQSEESQM